MTTAIVCAPFVACSRDEPAPNSTAPHRAPLPAAQPAAIRIEEPSSRYPVHRNITATVFWVGEPPSPGSPTNAASAWDERWQEHYGGFDDPKRRDGYLPRGFTPRENPFYVALPYNDFRKGKRADDAARMIPWFQERLWTRRESACKNRWVKVTRGGRVAYAQWEDVGPFVTDDADYVFGTAPPRNQKNEDAGIDISPAVRDCLRMRGGMGLVDWRFVDEADVPQGPWRDVVTRSQVDWN